MLLLLLLFWYKLYYDMVEWSWLEEIVRYIIQLNGWIMPRIHNKFLECVHLLSGKKLLNLPRIFDEFRGVACWNDVECWWWVLKLNVEVECWSWMLMLNVEVECWSWMLKLNVDVECWCWMLKLNVEVECWSWMLKLNVEVECWC